MSELKISLKQHTPIIHFEHDINGATLRATELKPKLDKFLIDKCFKNEPEYARYVVGYMPVKNKNDKKENKDKKKALDYKVTIKCKDKQMRKKVFNEKEKKMVTPDPLAPYFGNMGDGEKKYEVWSDFNTPIEITFFSFHDKLLDIIKDNICNFFAYTNFGTRQNKGFGSFYVDEEDQCYKKIETILPDDTYYLYIDNIKNEVIFEGINEYYKKLKSGRNPYLLEYIEQNTKLTWEKYWINQTFFKKFKKNNKKSSFIKILLGLAENLDYSKSNKGKILISHQDIQRFKSPLTFKVIKGDNKTKVYILVEDHFIKDILNKEFSFVYEKQNEKQIKKLKTPEKSEIPDKFIFELIQAYSKSKYNVEKKGKLNEISMRSNNSNKNHDKTKKLYNKDHKNKKTYNKNDKTKINKNDWNKYIVGDDYTP